MANNTIIEPVTYLQTVFSGLPYKIIISLIIFLIGFTIGKALGKIITKFFSEIEINILLRKNFNIKMDMETTIGNLVSYIIYFLSLIYALDQIGFANIILHLISIAIVLMVFLSLFLGIRDFFPNLMSGIYIAKKDMLKEGSSLEIDNIKGKIVKIDLIQIKIETKKGDTIYIPNSLITKKKILIKKN